MEHRNQARRGREYQEQKQLFAWTRQPSIRGRWPELKLLHHIKNEDRQATAAVIAIDKAAGVKKGVPDLCLPVARGGWHGLYIEMKAPGGRPTQEQLWWLEELMKQGYYAAICCGWEAATMTLSDYLGGEILRDE